jgi:hypothetical protein
VLVKQEEAVFSQWEITDRAVRYYPKLDSPGTFYSTGLLTILALGSMIPLAFVGTLLDIQKKRHSAEPVQSTLPILKPVQLKYMTRGQKVLLTVCLISIPVALWLGWPSRPAYESVWRDHGFPVTLQELNDSYPAVPDEENVALEYLAAFDLREQRADAFARSRTGRTQSPGFPPFNYRQLHRPAYDDILVLGKTPIEAGVPISADSIQSTSEYWENVTNYVVPQLKEIATRGEVRSRYPVDIRASLSINTSHEEKLRDLSRELMLDAVYRALNGETTQAVESILAIQAVADSHEDTPTLFSIDKKLAILNTAQRAIQAVLNITYIPERDLEILQEELQEYSEHFLNTEYYQRMIMADRVINLNMIQYASGDYKAQNAGALVFRKLQNPTAAELLVFSLAYEK